MGSAARTKSVALGCLFAIAPIAILWVFALAGGCIVSKGVDQEGYGAVAVGLVAIAIASLFLGFVGVTFCRGSRGERTIAFVLGCLSVLLPFTASLAFDVQQAFVIGVALLIVAGISLLAAFSARIAMIVWFGAEENWTNGQ